jgi:hypothetical protein
MQIIVGLIVLAVLLTVGLAAGILGSLVLGALLAGFAKTRPIAPILVAIVPLTMVGALSGGLGLGYLALQLNDSAVVIGAGAGLLLGAAAGFGLGVLAAALWWWRITRHRFDGAV